MTRRTLALAFFAAAMLAGEAFGQPPAPPRYSPTFSPYLNLARGNSSPVLNYYGLVRPQIESRAAFQTLQGEILQNRQSTNVQKGVINGGYGPLSSTGFQAGYMTHYAYFLNSGSGAGAGRGSVGGSRGFGGGGAAGFAQGAGGPGSSATGNIRPPASGVRR